MNKRFKTKVWLYILFGLIVTTNVNGYSCKCPNKPTKDDCFGYCFNHAGKTLELAVTKPTYDGPGTVNNQNPWLNLYLNQNKSLNESALDKFKTEQMEKLANPSSFQMSK